MLGEKFFEELEDYIELHSSVRLLDVCKSIESDDLLENNIILNNQQSELEDFIKINRKPTLKEVLFSFIDKKGTTDSDTYKKAGIDRKHFSKIRTTPNYRPKKNTIIALALALELSKPETEKLLTSAGYSLSESETSDLVIQFCIEKKIYDVDYVNQALDYYRLKPLTSF
ncbi:hypothetical protein [Litchfieldia alkalitelluris]|uniref:hypothetical protein n=1 Tax=Litchfieldia alkalitelluris TaxID=304268 RepID=UPI000996E910|nr:hypothetical protein [Litchfieldia alkalitelluris]